MKFARPISGHQERVQSIALEGQYYKGLHRVSLVKGKGSQVRGLTKALLKSKFGLAAAFVSGRRQDDRAAVATLNAADLQIMDSAGFFKIVATAATVARTQTRSPWRSRRGRSRPRLLKSRMTLATVRNLRKVSNKRSRRCCTSILGSLTTSPHGSRTRPIGRLSASSPRSAFAKRPDVSRARIVCSSSSDIVPFKPNSNRPLGLAGS